MVSTHGAVQAWSARLSWTSEQALLSFAAWLQARGHRRTTVELYTKAVRHLLLWLRNARPGVPCASQQAASQFLAHLPRCRCPVAGPRGVVTVRAAVNHFRRLTLSTRRTTTTEGRHGLSWASTLGDYRTHLRETCGLAETTCEYRSRDIQEFLRGSRVVRTRHGLRIDVASMIDQVAAIAKSRGAAMARRMADSLRSYLRWLALRGLVDEQIALAVPRIPQWPLATIPHTLSSAQLSRLLGSFDRRSPSGRRDLAMALCMVQLGLRASEVARMTIADIDWSRPTMCVSGDKSSRTRLLPLPHRVGAAIADYLKRGRPATKHAQLFVRHTVPRGSPLESGHVRGAMRRAYARAGFPAAWTGTHLLRHTAATMMHAKGATLKEIADTLGHLSINTTRIYTKVDLPALKVVALPWPEEKP